MTYTDRRIQAEDGLTLSLRDYNATAPGTPVLCLHGLTRNARDFSVPAERLAQDRRVLVLEQRGRGHSEYDPEPSNYQLPVYVRDTLRVLHVLGITRVIVVGTSMGGLIGMLMAAAPETRVAAMVLNDIGPEINPEGLARVQQSVAQTVTAADWSEATAHVRRANAIAFPDWQDEDWLRFAENLFEVQPEGGLRLSFDPGIGTAVNAAPEAAAPDLWPLFEALADVPLLAVRGELSDILGEDTVAKMADRHANLQVATVARVGHAPMLDEPEAWQALSAFVAQHP